jgi:diguanylate cyclase (GGDEF)-like protein
MAMSQNPLNVLLIEDDEDDRVLLQGLLDDLQYVNVVLRWESTYDGGRAALHSGEFDLCFLDYRLGRHDGLALLRELDRSAPITPIIFLTGQDSRELDLEAMAAGAADYLVKGKFDPPLLERAIRYALERHRLLMEVHRRALVDALTGALNRRGLEEQMGREIKLARRRGRPMTLLFADIDEFKSVNDRYGHAEGDRALREVADLLRASFRESDLVARIGGDEFVVVALDTAIDGIAVPEQRLRRALARRNRLAPYPLSLTVGLSPYDSESPCSFWDLVDRADQQMYHGKRSARAAPTTQAPEARESSASARETEAA